MSFPVSSKIGGKLVERDIGLFRGNCILLNKVDLNSCDFHCQTGLQLFKISEGFLRFTFKVSEFFFPHIFVKGSSSQAC